MRVLNRLGWATHLSYFGVALGITSSLACSALVPEPPSATDTVVSPNAAADGGTTAESRRATSESRQGSTNNGVDAATESTTSSSTAALSSSEASEGAVPSEAGGPSMTTSEPGLPDPWLDAGPVCNGTTCVELPPPYCKDATLLTSFGDGGVYDTVCEFGCVDGECSEDPCLGVVCDDPSAGSCRTATEFVAFDPEGSCVDGECVYNSRSVACDCENDACLTDPCEDVVCDEPPAPRCNDNGTRTEYAAVGTCEQGSCTYEASFLACEACSAGECYCPKGFAVGENAGECERCASGTFSDQTNSAECRAQTTCNPGKYISDVGSSKEDRQCSDCRPGTFSTLSNLPQCSPFSDCLAGQYVAASGTSTRDRQCAGCPTRSFSTGTNVASCVSWTSCTKGQYVSGIGSPTQDQTCSSCGANSYSATSDAPSCTQHTNCSPGQRVSQSASSTRDRQCTACTNGFSTTQNADTCSSYSTCAPGQYVQQQGTPTSNRVCAACPAGTFSVTNDVGSCTPYTVCGLNRVEGNPGTKTTDRTCVCASGFTECNGQCVATTSITYYLDGDGDGFGDATNSAVSCTGAPTGRVANKTDCCDADARAKPGQTEWFDEVDGQSNCGGYDFDCDGVEVQSDIRTAHCGGGGGGCGCDVGWVGQIPSCGNSGSYSYGGAGCSNFPELTQSCH